MCSVIPLKELLTRQRNKLVLKKHQIRFTKPSIEAKCKNKNGLLQLL